MAHEKSKRDRGRGKKSFRAQMRASLMNPGFFCGTVLLATVFLIAAYPYREYLLETGGSVEGAAWIAVFACGVASERSLLFLPLLVPLAASAEVSQELKSRYALFLVARTGKKSYVTDKICGTACAGGLMTVLAMTVMLAAAAVWCADIPDLSHGSAVISGWSILPDMACGFLNGALWSLVGSAAAVLSRNHYVAYAVPFILYYVLAVFQERYYTELYFLNPRQWAYPSYYGAGVCIVLLTLLGGAASFTLGKLMERRLS